MTKHNLFFVILAMLAFALSFDLFTVAANNDAVLGELLFGFFTVASAVFAMIAARLQFDAE